MYEKLEGLKERIELISEIIITGMKGLQKQMELNTNKTISAEYEDYILSLIEKIKIMKKPNNSNNS